MKAIEAQILAQTDWRVRVTGEEAAQLIAGWRKEGAGSIGAAILQWWATEDPAGPDAIAAPVGSGLKPPLPPPGGAARTGGRRDGAHSGTAPIRSQGSGCTAALPPALPAPHAQSAWREAPCAADDYSEADSHRGGGRGRSGVAGSAVGYVPPGPGPQRAGKPQQRL